MVVRPGLEQFLRVTSQSYVVYMYTMGDEDYAKAVLRVIDPRNVYFSGGVCCWNPQESRTHKELGRVVCEPSMALIVDDSPDVWSRDLRNLCGGVGRLQGDVPSALNEADCAPDARKEPREESQKATVDNHKHLEKHNGKLDQYFLRSL